MRMNFPEFAGFLGQFLSLKRFAYPLRTWYT